MLDKILWVTHGDQRDIFLRHSQPMTATQVARRRRLSVDRCNYILTELATRGLMRCLNPSSRRSRLFWLTRLGRAWQRRLRQLDGMPPLRHDCPDLDWDVHGSLCHTHRSAVVKTLTQPMQPAQIKRKALFQNPQIRMSANNVRDVMRFLRTAGVVQPVRRARKTHPLYELAEAGRHMQRLLVQAEVGR